MDTFNTLLVGGIPLMIVIFGLVEFSKSLGLSGKWLTVFSLLLGFAFGFAYQLATVGVPVAFGGWFGIVVYGLALGLVTSGFYDFVNARVPAMPKEPTSGLGMDKPFMPPPDAKG